MKFLFSHWVQGFLNLSTRKFYICVYSFSLESNAAAQIFLSLASISNPHCFLRNTQLVSVTLCASMTSGIAEKCQHTGNMIQNETSEPILQDSKHLGKIYRR